MCVVQSDRTCVSSLIWSQDAYARGEVFIGSKENSYTVLPGLPQNVQGHHWPHGITIVTPDRKFLFACETEEDQKEWMAALQTVINRPMLPQEYAGKLGASLSRCLARVFSLFLRLMWVIFQFSPQWRPISSTNHDRDQCLKSCRRRMSNKGRAAERERPEYSVTAFKKEHRRMTEQKDHFIVSQHFTRTWNHCHSGICYGESVFLN